MKFTSAMVFGFTCVFFQQESGLSGGSSFDPSAVFCDLDISNHVAQPAAASVRTLKVSYVKGRATFTRSGQQPVPLARGMELSVTDVIRTGSHAFVSLSNGQNNQINIHPDTTGILSWCQSVRHHYINSVESDKSEILESRISVGTYKQVEHYVPWPHLSAAVRG